MSKACQEHPECEAHLHSVIHETIVLTYNSCQNSMLIQCCVVTQAVAVQPKYQSLNMFKVQEVPTTMLYAEPFCTLCFDACFV